MSTAKNIFLSDDDIDDRLFFKSAFEEVCCGHSLSLFENNTHLLEQLNQEDTSLPDIVFIDLNMPMINGLECLRLIREIPRLKNLPVIVYSTIRSEVFIEEVRTLGAAHFIKKPYDFYELVNLIKYVVEIDWSNQADTLPFEDFVLTFNSIKRSIKL